MYPQYSWKFVSPVIVTGYGFVERAPGEPLFTNHVNTATVSAFPYVSVRTETGGAPVLGNYFFQVGPQVNLHEVVRPLKKELAYLIVAQLPKLAGGRPPNTLIAGGTREFKITDGLGISAEGYRRFFPGGRPDYGEYWVVLSVKKLRHIHPALFVLQDGDRVSVAFGARLTP